jgi:hypothetical protein
MQSPALDPTVVGRARPMRTNTLDPTAGERARLERSRPGAAHPVTDPTDPRHARLPALEARPLAGVPGAIVDPTDPECGLSVRYRITI